jgi:hypothetical protein
MAAVAHFAPKVRPPLIIIAKCSMSNATPTDLYARRWEALLTDNDVLQKEHVRLLASFTAPFSLQQAAQLEASTARLQMLSVKVRDLVDDWVKTEREYRWLNK